LAAADPAAVARAFEAACLAELRAIKPGNVFVGSEGHRMTVADFERSAAVAAPALLAPAAGVGERVLSAVRATRTAVGQNTNLGILLLVAPLVEAALSGATGADLPAAIETVLGRLDRGDAEAAFAAIRLANPGGLGASAEQDVAAAPSCTLLEAMALAADRDRIAWNYVNGLADVLVDGPARLAELAARGWPADRIVTGVHLGFLGRIPDSHVARKHGPAAAMALTRRVAVLDARLLAVADPATLEPLLLDLDRELKRDGVNPGTSADLTVATLFAHAMMNGCNPALPDLGSCV